MESSNIRRLSRKLHMKYHMYRMDLNTIRQLIKDEGYTIIEYSIFENSSDVDVIIQSLDLEPLISHSNGFTYASENFRLVFVNNDLSDKEKTVLLTHEAGHIVCEHMNHKSLLGKNVLEEDEANQFVHYLLRPNIWERSLLALCIYKKYFISSLLVVILAILAVLGMRDFKIEQTFYEKEFYVTESGERYHRENCMHIANKKKVRRLTWEEFEEQTYTPCQVCLPE